MSKGVNFVKVKINDIFDFRRGKVISKKDIKDNEGIYPVYSSQTKNEGILGHISSYMFDVHGITWTTDGANAGTTFVRSGKFNITNVCGLMTLKSGVTNINLDYVCHLLDFTKISKTDGNRKVMTDTILKADLSVEIPITDEGIYDIEKQKDLANKYVAIKEQKQLLLLRNEQLRQISVKIPQEQHVNWAYPCVKDLFYPKGGNADFTKTWVSKNTGDIPLYSGTTTGDYAKINVAEYSGEYLTWCIDGLAGYMMYHNEEFSLTCHRGVLIPTDKCENIDLKYIKYVLEPIFRKRKKGREGDLGKNEYTSLKPIVIKRMKDTIPIPVKEDGTFDIQKQRELAEKYEQIEEMKRNISQKILELSEIVVL